MSVVLIFNARAHGVVMRFLCFFSLFFASILCLDLPQKRCSSEGVKPIFQVHVIKLIKVTNRQIKISKHNFFTKSPNRILAVFLAVR